MFEQLSVTGIQVQEMDCSTLIHCVEGATDGGYASDDSFVPADALIDRYMKSTGFDDSWRQRYSRMPGYTLRFRRCAISPRHHFHGRRDGHRVLALHGARDERHGGVESPSGLAFRAIITTNQEQQVLDMGIMDAELVEAA